MAFQAESRLYVSERYGRGCDRAVVVRRVLANIDGANTLITTSAGTWGWIHLIGGIIGLAAGFGVFFRSGLGAPAATAHRLAVLRVLATWATGTGRDSGLLTFEHTARPRDRLDGHHLRRAHPRNTIEHSIGPVWEANHVWLIFIFVILWTSSPEAYASITLTLFVPLTIAALGIVLRGASFAFRKAVVTLRRTFGAAFAASSVLVPYCFGAVAGGIASGRVPAGGQAGDPVHSLDQPNLNSMPTSRRWPPSHTWPPCISSGTPAILVTP
jgi:hypothetical protein